MPIFRLAMNPASDGDSLLLTWGAAERPHRALIDLGRAKDYRALKPTLERIDVLDLLVLTHIDADHIEGVVPLFKEPALPLRTATVWFNAHAQLVAANERLPARNRVVLGPAQAEKVTAGIVASTWPWNMPFDSGIVSIDSPEAAQPHAIAGGLTLTLLSPTDRKLAELQPAWNRELEAHHLRTTDPDEVEVALASGRVRLGSPNVAQLVALPFKEDMSEPNGASIAFVAEFDGKRILMGADAHPGVLEASLRRLGASETKRYHLDCFKVSHHGSRANTSPSLLGILDCTCFAFSTDGSRHGHPDPEAIARILAADPNRHKTLIFNFRPTSTQAWDDEELMMQWNYTCVFPKGGSAGIEFDI